MKSTVTILAALIATPAAADPGHFTSVHGHSHWIAAGALTLAAVIAIALWRSASIRRSNKAERKA